MVVEPVNVAELEAKVKEVYKDVAEKPVAERHFEIGRALAEKLGYPARVLDEIPAQSIESFAGVGYHFALADLQEGETVLDLGSGSGMDAFFAALKVGALGKVVGVDMTDAQLDKANRLKGENNFANACFIKSYIEDIPENAESFDCVISNGVINLSADKEKVFQEAFRLLKKGGRLAVSDIVTTLSLSQRIKTNAELWAACIGGALPKYYYAGCMEQAGFRVERVVENPQYHFLTHDDVMVKYGVQSISMLARKP